MIGSFLPILLGLGLGQSVTRLYYEWEEQSRPKKVGTLWLLSLTSSFTLGSLSLGVLSLVSDTLFPETKFFPLLFLGLLGQIIGDLITFPMAVIRIMRRANLFAILSLGRFAFTLALSLYFVISLDRGVKGYFEAMICGNGLNFLLCILVLSKHTRLSFWDPCVREALRFSLPLVPGGIISSLTNTADRFFLQSFVSIEALGIYNLSLKFANVVSSFHYAMKMSFVPFMYENVGNHDGLDRIYRVKGVFIFATMTVAVGIFTLSDDLISWLGQPDYYPIAEWIPIVTTIALLPTLTIYFGPGIGLSKRTELSLIPTLLNTVIVIGGGFILIPLFELPGIMFIRFFSAFAIAAVTILISAKVYPMKMNWLLLSSIISIYIVATGIHHFLVFQQPVSGLMASFACILLFILPTGWIVSRPFYDAK